MQYYIVRQRIFMASMKQLSLLFLLLSFSTSVSAQCLDTLQFPNLQPPCNLFFSPVCGCDGITYRNSCYADFATVLQYSEGPCEQVAMDFFPNPVVDVLNLTLVTRYEINVNFYIFDRNGNMYFYRYFPNVLIEHITLPVSSFEQGLYIVVAEANGQTFLSKLVRVNQ